MKSAKYVGHALHIDVLSSSFFFGRLLFYFPFPPPQSLAGPGARIIREKKEEVPTFHNDGLE